LRNVAPGLNFEYNHPTMKIIVLIVTYNGERWLDNCLSSLTRSTVPLEVVIVDNNSSDSTLDIIGKYNVSKLFALDENLGFGKANNLGIKYALEESADYVFLLNQDAWIRPDTIDELVQASQRNPEYFVLSPLHFDGTEKKLDYNFQHYISPPRCEDLLSDLEKENGILKDVYETPFVNAALWLLPNACLKQIGGFDPIFPHYGEDNDFTKRVRYHGFKVGVCPKAVGVHDREQRNDFTPEGYKKKTLKRRKTDALIRLKDINSPLEPVVRGIYKKALKRSVKNLLAFDLPEFSNELKIISYTTSKLKAIREHRKISEQLEAPLKWLPQIPK
jgi:GT2 family glycosyltransferase